MAQKTRQICHNQCFDGGKRHYAARCPVCHKHREHAYYYTYIPDLSKTDPSVFDQKTKQKRIQAEQILWNWKELVQKYLSGELSVPEIPKARKPRNYAQMTPRQRDKWEYNASVWEAKQFQANWESLPFLTTTKYEGQDITFARRRVWRNIAPIAQQLCKKISKQGWNVSQACRSCYLKKYELCPGWDKLNE